MTTNAQYDAIIIGAGQAGLPLSMALAGANWKVALVEREHVGGTCVNPSLSESLNTLFYSFEE